MISMYVVLLAITVLVSVPYLLPADASIEMKYVPFWWSTDPLTGEAVYTDYFNEVSSVHLEHKSYLASIAKESTTSTINASIMLEVERSDLVEVITYEIQNVKVKDSLFDHGLYANPDYTNRELVAVSTWVPAPEPEVSEEIEEVIPEEVTEDVTVDVTDVITEITPEIVPEIIVDEPRRVASGYSNTHWDSEEQIITGHDYMTSQQIKDHKKHMAEWKAYETLSKLYPSQYPPYVHVSDDTHGGMDHDKVVKESYTEPVEEIIVVPIPVEQPRVTSSEIVVPVPEPIVEPVPVPGVTSSEIVVPVPEPIVEPEVPIYEQDLTDEEWDGQLDIIKQFPESLTNSGTIPGIPVLPNVTINDGLVVVPLN